MTEMDRDKLKKLKKILKDDRPSKLKSYIKKHKLHDILADTELSRGRSLLHYCCSHGSGLTLRILLKEGVNPAEPDNEGNLPAHVALQRALDTDSETETQEVYREMIIPLVEACPGSLDEKNYKHISCRQLLEQVIQKNKQEHHDESSATPSTDWSERLADELSIEQEELYGRYTTETDFGEEQTRESYDRWADRMQNDYHLKQQHQPRRPRHHRQQKGQKQYPKKSSVVDEEELRKIREKLKRKYEENQKRTVVNHKLRRKDLYEKKFKTLLETKEGELRFEDIPWPSRGSTSDVTDVIFSGFAQRTGEKFKKCLREQQIRWHPDKFTQKFGKRIIECEKDNIMQRVKEISQALNKISESLPT